MTLPQTTPPWREALAFVRSQVATESSASEKKQRIVGRLLDDIEEALAWDASDQTSLRNLGTLAAVWGDTRESWEAGFDPRWASLGGT